MNIEIRKWMYRNARPIELARYQYHFESGEKKEVLTCLSAYQNEDGGFAHALEADSWNINSSAIQTWTATEILYEIEMFDSDHPIIKSILSFLDQTETFVSNRWQNTIPSNNLYPGAPWWLYEENDPSNLRYNPSACLAGFILLHSHKESALYNKAMLIAKESIDFFITESNLDEMHEVFCFMRLRDYMVKADLEAFENFDTFSQKLEDIIHLLIEDDFSKWSNAYICKPSQFFISPSSRYYERNKAAVDFELKHLDDSKNSEGVWDIPWSWGKDELEFSVSRKWWQGNFVIKNLLMIKYYK